MGWCAYFRPSSFPVTLLPADLPTDLLIKSALKCCASAQLSPPKSIIPERVAVTHRAFYHKTRQQLAANLRDSSFLKRSFDLPEGEAFTRDALLMLLSNPRARFVRAYLGNKNGQVKLILVPVDARGNDILNPLLNESGRPINYDSLQLRNTRFFDFSGQTVESDMRCPLGCSSYLLQDDLAQSVESLEETISSLRLISYNLLPHTLENHGLCEAVAEFLERVNQQHQLEIEVDIEDRPAITKDREIHVFRIIQEITHNTIKHAGAKLLQIIFKREGKDFLVLLQENGIGFNVSDSKLGSQGLGLKSIESRSEVLEGTLKIESEPGKGTNYVLRFPENPAILAS